MNFKCLIPGQDLMRNASGAIEKHLFTCLDFVCTFVLQNPEYQNKEQIANLFNMYLNMLIENDDEEDNECLAEELCTHEFIEFVWELYNQVYRYVRPMLISGRHCVYSLEHMEVINQRILFSIEVDDLDGEPECAPNSIPHLPLSI